MSRQAKASNEATRHWSAPALLQWRPPVTRGRMAKMAARSQSQNCGVHQTSSVRAAALHEAGESLQRSVDALCSFTVLWVWRVRLCSFVIRGVLSVFCLPPSCRLCV